MSDKVARCRLLFVIGIEILARETKNDAGIKGINVGRKEIRVSLYADDTTVYHLLTLLDKFKNLSGLEVTQQSPRECGLVNGKIKPKLPLAFVGRRTQ